MIIVVAGGRDFNDYDLLKRKLDYYLQNVEPPIIIVSGCAPGADTLGERYANEKGYELMKYPADWERYGKRAGYIRNTTMAKVGEALVAFWDGVSKGTKLMIDLAKKYGLLVRIIRY